MFKLTAIVFLCLGLCIVADPIREKPLRNSVLDRAQQQTIPAPTGYPPAGVTPEIPFELPTETENPRVTEKPDVIYAPAETEAEQPNEIYGPPESNPQLPNETPEDKTMQPEIGTTPEIIETADEDEEEESVNEFVEDLDDASDADNTVISVATTFEKPARLVYQRFPQSRQPPTAVPARLRKEGPFKPINFVYTSRFQTFPQK